MKQAILTGKPVPDFKPTSSSLPMPSQRARVFVQSLLVREQRDRCTAQEALKLAFVCPNVEPPSDQASDLTPSFKFAREQTRAFPKSSTKFPDPTLAKQLD